MEINKQDIKIIMTSGGAVFIGIKHRGPFGNDPKYTTLESPFRIVMGNQSVAFAAPLLGEKNICIEMTGTVQMEVTDKALELYRKYYEQVFGSGLIVPEKRIIT